MSFLFREDLAPKYNGPGDEEYNNGLVRDIDSYMALFSGAGNKSVIGESSTCYLYHPSTAISIKHLIPNAKIIMILRNPVDRAYSAYLHLKRDRREKLSFTDAISTEAIRKESNYMPLWYYREVGLYAQQIQRYFDVFEREQIMVILYDDLATDPQKVMANIFRFIGVRDDFQVNASVRYNMSRKPSTIFDIFSALNKTINKDRLKPLIPNPVRKFCRELYYPIIKMTLEPVRLEYKDRVLLYEYFANDIEALEELLGVNLSSWRPRVEVILQ